ncbi:SSrecog-domain-containing protein [Exidia glandulosa HHB12029]|uniref:FACT complex subunit POB3 n=1 Tax=Exidia glandulosa HHB12029 TaxID=1314781 RepID=A0A165P1Q9_EXIGL|nr:SSrecog-domain-containing protein [Exidia glandulosa HHB12029]
MATSQFDNVYHGLSTELGKIRLAQTGIAWKALQGDSTATIAAANIKWAQWLRVARNFQLRVGLKDNRRRETFDGFQREDHDKLAAILKQFYDIALETKDISFKGWNWGATDFQGEDLAFLVSNKTAFEVPMKYVANSNIAGKTEVSIEFAPSTDKKPGKGRGIDELVEMRFYVPGVAERSASDNEDNANKDDEEEQSAAQVFSEAIRDRAEIGQGIMGESIVLFEDVLVITPRGRYDIDMFEDFMRLRGKTYDYKILYSQISKLFLLPKSDDIHVQFIIGLEPPIRQGQTKYPYLVTMFSRDQELEIDLNLEDEALNTKYDGKLDKHYETSMYQVVSSVFRGLTGKKITGTSSFQSCVHSYALSLHADFVRSVSGHPSIKCNLKAAQGELFILEKFLFFVTKQPTLIQLDDIHQAVFSRLGSARTIDVKIIQQTGPEIVFSGVNKEEHEGLEEFLKGKKVRTKNEMGDELLAAALGDDGEDDDEEMQSVASSDEEPARPRAANGDDEDSEEGRAYRTISRYCC